MAVTFSQAYRGFTQPRTLRRKRRPVDARSALRAAVAPPLAPQAGKFDWREKIAINPPGNQGSCYACTSFALSATLEALLTIAHRGPTVPLSAGFIHTCIGHADDVDPKTICNAGCDLYQTLSLLQTEQYARATPGDYPFASAACVNAPTLAVIADFNELDDATSAKNSIASDGPVAADLYIWQDFFSYTTSKAPYYVPDTSTAGPYLHSVCVVGFDSDGWIIKNSLGPSWGDGGGFATISYGAPCGLIGAPAPANRSSRVAYSLRV